MMELEKALQAWKTESDFTRMQKIWDLRADEFNEQKNKEKAGERVQEVLTYLQAKHVLDQSAAVLDIGCGPGKFAIKFAEIAASVTGIDISPNMLRYAQENAKERRVEAKTFFQREVWEQVDLSAKGWDGSFDLVFASMCPGISGAEALLNMCKVSRKACFMSSFVQRQDHILDTLTAAFYGKLQGDRWGRNMYHAFQVLFLSGYYPEITYHDTLWERVMTLEEAVQAYTPFFLEEGVSDGETAVKVKSLLRPLLQDGRIQEKSVSKIAWLYWRVDDAR